MTKTRKAFMDIKREEPPLALIVFRVVAAYYAGRQFNELESR